MSDLVDLKNELSHLSVPDLVNIYAIFSQRLTHVIDVQWKLASIFIPLSLSGAIFLNEGQRQVIIVGLFSILLIWIWYMFERRNQRSILRQQTMLAAIGGHNIFSGDCNDKDTSPIAHWFINGRKSCNG